MKIFTAEIGGVAIAAQGFATIEDARADFHEGALRLLARQWESETGQRFSSGAYVVREASEDEAQSWRDGRSNFIRERKHVDPDMNPQLYFDPTRTPKQPL
jgi:hypothetical protein